jgi:ABC-2 type transport system ATP-binding protein
MKDGIVTSGLRKTFCSKKGRWGRRELVEKVAVDGLDLKIPPGRVTGLLGLNGAGKTTTIKMLATLLLPTEGAISVDGVDAISDPFSVRRRINMITGGERMIYWRLTGRENLDYFGALYNIPRAVLLPRIAELLDLVELSDAADIPVERYSKGMKQRLQIARGLINDPSALLLDEPTLGLDVPIALRLREVVADFAAKGRSVLLTSHYLAEVEQLCGHLYVIDGGRMVAEGSPTDLKRLTGQQRVITLDVAYWTTKVAEAVADLAALTGATFDTETGGAGTILTVRSHDDLAGQFAAGVVLAGGEITRLEVAVPTLEDAILALSNPERVIA